MPRHNPNLSESNRGNLRIPAWAGYLLIASDVARRPLFLVPWLGTLAALSIVWPTQSIWVWAGVLALVSGLTLAGITRAVAIQTGQRGALGAYVARLATHTRLGRWLLRWLDRSSNT